VTSITILYRNLYFKKKLATFAQILGTCLVQKYSRIKVHNALDPRERGGGEIKTTDINRDENFQKTAEYNLLDHKRNVKNFGTVESGTSPCETKKK
jgi:hypothetical protein